MATERKKEFDAYITIRCSESTRNGLTALAQAERRSMSNYLRVVLERHVAEMAAKAEAEQPAAAAA